MGTWGKITGGTNRSRGDQSAMEGFGNIASGFGSDLQQLGDTDMFGWKMDPNNAFSQQFLSQLNRTPEHLKAWGITSDANTEAGGYGASGSYGPGYAQFKVVKDYQGNQYAVPIGYESYGAHLFSPDQMQQNFGQNVTSRANFYKTQEEADAGAAEEARVAALPNLDTMQEEGMGWLQDYMKRGRGLLTGGRFDESPEYEQTRQQITDILNPELQSRGLLTSGQGLRSIEDAYSRAGTEYESERNRQSTENLNTGMGWLDKLLTGGSGGIEDLMAYITGQVGQ